MRLGQDWGRFNPLIEPLIRVITLPRLRVKVPRRRRTIPAHRRHGASHVQRIRPFPV
jgi:hypothetical protein